MDDERIELYGFATDDIEEVRVSVERALGVTFEPFESELVGAYYFAAFCAPHAELTLRVNAEPGYDTDSDDPEDALAEPDFPDHGVLLYAEWTTTGHTCHEKVGTLGTYGQLLAVE